MPVHNWFRLHVFCSRICVFFRQKQNRFIFSIYVLAFFFLFVLNFTHKQMFGVIFGMWMKSTENCYRFTKKNLFVKVVVLCVRKIIDNCSTYITLFCGRFSYLSYTLQQYLDIRFRNGNFSRISSACFFPLPFFSSWILRVFQTVVSERSTFIFETIEN